MDDRLRQAYREARRRRWPWAATRAEQALRIARAALQREQEQEQGPRFDGDERCEWQVGPYTLRARIVPDEHVTLDDAIDYCGTVKAEREMSWRDYDRAVKLERDCDRWLVLTNGNSYLEQRQAFERFGRGMADFLARYSIARDVERVRGFLRGDWWTCGVEVTAWLGGVQLGAASLWGIESDAGAYFDEVAREVAADALHEASRNARAVCAAIRAA